MENQNQSHGDETKNITLKSVLAWIFGVLFLLVGVSLLFTDPVSGIVFLLCAALTLPVATKFLKDKTSVTLSAELRFVIVIILFGVVIGLSLSSKKDNSAMIQATSQVPAVTTTAQQQPVTSTTQPTASIARKATPVKTTPTPVVSNPQPATTPTTNSSQSVSTETVSQENAVAKAKDYLNYSAFSHDGLVAQLEYDQFSAADAVYGADNSGANWNDQAAAKAKDYMSYSAFSRGSLIAQLEYDKFTQAQAEYGADAVGL